MEKDGYIVKFALVLVYSAVVDEKQMYVIGERENTKENGGMMGIPESEIKTKDKGKLQDGFTTGGIYYIGESIL